MSILKQALEELGKDIEVKEDIYDFDRKWDDNISLYVVNLVGNFLRNKRSEYTFEPFLIEASSEKEAEKNG